MLRFGKLVLEKLRKPEILAFLYFTAMTVLMTYPLVLRMRNYVIGQIGDNVYFVWLIHWFQDVILKLHISPFFDPFLNYPQGWNLASTDTSPIMVALALPGSLLFGHTWGFNFVMLVSFILSGFAMFLWIKHLTGDGVAAIIAGTSGG